MDFVLRKICVSYGKTKKFLKYFEKNSACIVQLLDNQSQDIALQLGILVIKAQPQKFNKSLINLNDRHLDYITS